MMPGGCWRGRQGKPLPVLQLSLLSFSGPRTTSPMRTSRLFLA